MANKETLFTDFEQQMEKLKATFGANNYSVERSKAVWQDLASKLPIGAFERIVARLIRTQKYALLPDEMIQFAKDKGFLTGEQNQVPVTICVTCNNNGFLTATTTKGYDYCVACNCKNAERVNRNHREPLMALNQFLSLHPGATYKKPSLLPANNTPNLRSA